MPKNVKWVQTVYGESVSWSNDACLAVEAFRNRPDIFARRTSITGDELVAGIREAISPIFLRDYNRLPTDTECSYGLVASRRHESWDCFEDTLMDLNYLDALEVDTALIAA